MSESASTYDIDGEVVTDEEENKALSVESRTTSLDSIHDTTSIHPLIQAVMDKKLDTGSLKELLEIQMAHEAHEAKKMFYQALAEFKKSAPAVIKDKINTQFGSKYASKAALINTINPVLGEFNLSATWDVDQDGDRISVTCILSHSLGHEKQVTIGAKPDTSGAKNPIQQIKSTITYLEIATYEAVTGVATTDGDADDDGNSFSSFETGTQEQRRQAQQRAHQDPKQLPPYPDDRFKKSFDDWQRAILDGKKTPKQIVSTVSTRFMLSDEQKAAIYSVA